MMNQSAQGLASLGRGNDSMLVHMTPREVQGLQGLAMAHGGSLTINPKTGLPEAGFLDSILPTVAGFGLNALFPGLGALGTGLLVGGVTALTSGDLGKGVMAGFGAGSGAGLGSTFSKMGQSAIGGITPEAAKMAVGENIVGQLPANVAQNAATNLGMFNSAGASPFMGAAGTTVPTLTQAASTFGDATSNLGAFNTGATGATAAMAPSASQIAQSQLSQPSLLGDASNRLGDMYKGASEFAKDPFGAGYDAFKAQGGNTFDLLSPVASVGMEALKPEPYAGYQDPDKDKYRGPQGQLNLSDRFDTGLRLVAKGGYIDGYATGGTVQSGGVRDLYGTPDNQPTMSSGLGGFGLGRLNDLASEQARTQAQTYGYAEGGVASLDLPDPSKTAPAPENLENMIINETAKTEMLANQLNNLTSNTLNTGNIPTQNYAPGAFSNAAAAMQNQPVLPQASFVQNLTSARTGYADGGDVSGSPSADVAAEIASSGIDPSLVYGDMVDDKARLPYVYDRILTRGALDAGRISPIEYSPYTYAGSLRRREGMARGGYLNGAGDGMSDSIPATIEGKQPARLADGEFVIPADVVSHLGNGSSKAGSKRLYAMLEKIRHARTGNKKQGKQINPSKYMPA